MSPGGGNLAPVSTHPGLPWVLVASDRVTGVARLARWPIDGGRGATAARVERRGMRRAEHGPAGPMVWEAEVVGTDAVVRVWSPVALDPGDAEAALTGARRWIGLADDPAPLTEMAHGVVAHLLRTLGVPVLGQVPGAGEAIGRAVLAQLVQGIEAGRSRSQLVRRLGVPANHGVTCWPTPTAIASTPAWELRRCGISLRGAGALHAAAMADRRLQGLVDTARAAPDVAAARAPWDALDVAIRSLPGCGVWTSGEARLALGDPDAVAVGDWHLPSVVVSVMRGPDPRRRREDCTDAEMLELLEPFRGQRGRVAKLCERAAYGPMNARVPRRGPRHAPSAHRYW